MRKLLLIGSGVALAAIFAIHATGNTETGFEAVLWVLCFGLFGIGFTEYATGEDRA